MALRSGPSSKKNDMMSQQIANSLKMSAYLNKNTFSSATALPPEENRLNMKDIVSKGSNPVWLRKGEVDVRSYPRHRERHFKGQLVSYKKDKKGNKGMGCRKCGQGEVNLSD
jgi:4-amino-4-deoxy-L-arabinose transferase-like glycosyltransferase